MKQTFLFVWLFASLPLFSQIRFLENKGQFQQPVQFYADLKGGAIFFEDQSFTYVYSVSDTAGHHAEHHSAHHHHKSSSDKFESYTINFINSNLVDAKGVGRLPGVTNYYRGNDTAHWASGVRAFRGVYYRSLYRNVDLFAYSSDDAFKYDFIVKPGAHISDVQMKYSDNVALSLAENGMLIIKTAINEVYEFRPLAFQIDKGDTTLVDCEYKLRGNTVSFFVKNYDRGDTLIIDPELIFSTYTGATADNWGSTATYDRDGNAITSGTVDQGVLGYPVEGGKLQFLHGGGHGTGFLWDAGIMKVSNDGREIIFATYFGGNGSDCPHSMVVNSKGELIVFGTTGSSDMPGAINDFVGGPKTAIEFEQIYYDNGSDMFVMMLDSRGRLLGSEYLGGSGNDGLNFEDTYDDRVVFTGTGGLYYNYGDWARGEVAVDSLDNIYIGCTTKSDDFPKAKNNHEGESDGILMRINPSLGLRWSRYIGGSSGDVINSIDVDKKNMVYYTGGTESNDMPVSLGAYEMDYLGGTTDAFLGKVDPNGNFVAQTYFGSAEYDQSYFVRVDKKMNVYIYGQTEAPGNELIFNAAYNTPNSGQFITKFTNDLSGLTWSTVFGTGSGKPNISPTAFSVDMCNRTYISGSGREWIYVAPIDYVPGEYYGYIIDGTNDMEVTGNAFDSDTDGQDFYIMVMLDDASALDYATFFGEQGDFRQYLYNPVNGLYEYNTAYTTCGTDHVDGGTSRFDRKGNVYQSVCAGCGRCQGLPTAPTDAVSTINASNNCNNAVAKFEIANDILIADFGAYNNPCVPNQIIFENKTNESRFGSGVKYQWSFGDGGVSTDQTPSPHNYSAEGDYLVRLIAEELSSCNLIDTMYKMVTVKNVDVSPVLDTPHICSGDTVALGFAEFDDPNFVYTWDPVDYLDDPTLSDPTAIVEDNVVYTITAETPYCQLTFTQTVDIIGGNLDPVIKIVGFSEKKKGVCLGETVVLKAITQNPVETYHWSYDADFSSQIPTAYGDSLILTDLTESDSIYLFTKGVSCNGTGKAKIFVPVVSSYVIVNADKRTVCANEVVMLYAQEVDQNPMEYQWSPAKNIASDPTSDTVFAVIEKPMSFSVIGTDTAGCEYKKSVFVDVDSVPIQNVVVDSVSCFNYADGAIFFEVNGQPPYQFQWADGSADAERKNLSAGSYSVTVTDDLGCQNDQGFVLHNPEQIELLLTVEDQRCQEVCNGYVIAKYYGGTGALELSVDGIPANDSVSGLCTGTYNLLVEDAEGCGTAKTISIALDKRLPYIWAFADSAVLVKGQSVLLHAAKDDRISETVEYVWSPDIWLAETVGPIVEAIPESDTVYSVVATDLFGCQNHDTVGLTVHDYMCTHPYVYVPSAFSPNGDGQNDVFKVYSRVLDQYSITVFNRWGQIVWTASTTGEFWDGTFEGKELMPAVFDFYLEGSCLDGEKVTLKGNLNLIR